MRRGQLRDYFAGVSVKRLSAVDSEPGKSNQHEVGTTRVMREQFLGERRTRFFTAYMAKAKQRMSIEIRQDLVAQALTTTGAGGTGVWSPEHGHFH